MAHIPNIIVQLIHIEGPLKGKEQEFSGNKIRIGRYPDFEVRYPKDYLIISKAHAEIVREGNRFKLIDTDSLNRTFIKGKEIHEAYLKSGDVIMLGEDGPKFSFLTRVGEGRPVYRERSPQRPPQRPPERPPQRPPQRPPEIEEQRIPLDIQYGPTIRSYKQLPITIGKSPRCDFTIDHMSVIDQHAQIFFREGQYYVKDLTGQNSVLINGQPVKLGKPLNPDNRLELSPHGPKFRFLSGGKLFEIED
jgi:pSer/pThr/pTyr-binding forkhead associated (FHA) protein